MRTPRAVAAVLVSGTAAAQQLVYELEATLVDPAPSISIAATGDPVGQNFGRTLASLDWTGDGIDDALAVGLSARAVAGVDFAGGVQIFDVATATIVSELAPPLPIEWGNFGGDLATANVDGGAPELLVASAGDGVASGHLGVVYLYGGLPGAPTELCALSEDESDRFGTTILAADLDADGDDEIVVADPWAAVEGRVYVYRYDGPGSCTRLGAIDEPEPDGRFGFGVVIAAGEVDGDPELEVIVGNRGDWTGGGVERGTVSAFDAFVAGSWAPALRGWLPNPDGLSACDVVTFYDTFPSALIAADLDGDGVDEIGASAPCAGPGDVGAVHLLSLEASGLTPFDRLRIPLGMAGPDAGLGYSLLAADADGDGDVDVFAGAWDGSVCGFPRETVWVFAGRTGDVITRIDDPELDGETTFGVALQALRRGPGGVQLAAGAPNVSFSSAADAGHVSILAPARTCAPIELESPAPQAGKRFGHAVAAIGDVSGDGLADYVVGAPDSYRPERTGAAYLFLSPFVPGACAVPRPPVPLAPASPSAGEQFGRFVAGVGDWSCDGWADVAVAGTALDPTSSDGRVVVFLGPALDADGDSVAESMSGRTVLPIAGSHVAALAGGDLDHDGCGDLLVGTSAPGGVGKVLVYPGGGRPPFTLSPPTGVPAEEVMAFGAAIAVVPDLGGDGADDVLIGASGAVNPLAPGVPGEGRAYLYLLGPDTSGDGRPEVLGIEVSQDGDPVESVPGFGNVPGAYGMSVSAVADFGADGVADLVIGAPGVGESFLADSAAAFTPALDPPGSAFLTGRGWAVTGVGLTTALGGVAPVFLAGAPWTGTDDPGLVQVVQGGATPTSYPLPTPFGLGPWDHFGESLAAAPDLGGDGLADGFIVGAPSVNIAPYTTTPPVAAVDNPGRAFIYPCPSQTLVNAREGACADGIDNDSDLVIDCHDADCAAACAGCVDPRAIEYDAGSGLLPEASTPPWRRRDAGAAVAIDHVAGEPMVRLACPPQPDGVGYLLPRPGLATAEHITVRARLRLAETCAGAHGAHAGLGLTDGARMAKVEVHPDGRVFLADGAGMPLSGTATLADPAATHELRIELERDGEASLFVDGAAAAAVTVPYQALPAAAGGPPEMAGGSLGFFGHGAAVRWRRVELSTCGEQWPAPGSCGDGECAGGGGETPCGCAADCLPACGDGCCSFGEDLGCPGDCAMPPPPPPPSPTCGDGTCAGGENPCTCAPDCTVTMCGDTCCQWGMEGATCAADCPPSPGCGDGGCDAGENGCWCPADCPPLCGDGCCDAAGEDAQTCSADCAPPPPPPPPPPPCGDGTCAPGESPCTCSVDCATPVCGDGCCTPASEGGGLCTADCPAPPPPVCGDGICNGDESACGCPADCPARCGDACCTGGERADSCALDCCTPATCAVEASGHVVWAAADGLLPAESTPRWYTQGDGTAALDFSGEPVMRHGCAGTDLGHQVPLPALSEAAVLRMRARLAPGTPCAGGDRHHTGMGLYDGERLVSLKVVPGAAPRMRLTDPAGGTVLAEAAFPADGALHAVELRVERGGVVEVRVDGEATARLAAYADEFAAPGTVPPLLAAGAAGIFSAGTPSAWALIEVAARRPGAAVCGDTFCDGGETQASCGADCAPPSCGDAACGDGETGCNCLADCGKCDRTAPAAPLLLAPAEGAALATPAPLFSGQAEPGATVTVTRLATDGVSSAVASTVATAQGTFATAPTASLPDGTYQVVATARDAAGNVSAPSAPRTFTIDTLRPRPPRLARPALDEIVRGPIDAVGTAEPGVEAMVWLDGALLGTVPAGADGRFVLPIGSLGPGRRSLRTQARDRAGNLSRMGEQVAFEVRQDGLIAGAKGLLRLLTATDRPQPVDLAKGPVTIEAQTEVTLAGGEPPLRVEMTAIVRDGVGEALRSLFAQAPVPAGGGQGPSLPITISVLWDGRDELGQLAARDGFLPYDLDLRLVSTAAADGSCPSPASPWTSWSGVESCLWDLIVVPNLDGVTLIPSCTDCGDRKQIGWAVGADRRVLVRWFVGPGMPDATFQIYRRTPTAPDWGAPLAVVTRQPAASWGFAPGSAERRALDDLRGSLQRQVGELGPIDDDEQLLSYLDRPEGTAAAQLLSNAHHRIAEQLGMGWLDGAATGAAYRYRVTMRRAPGCGERLLGETLEIDPGVATPSYAVEGEAPADGAWVTANTEAEDDTATEGLGDGDWLRAQRRRWLDRRVNVTWYVRDTPADACERPGDWVVGYDLFRCDEAGSCAAAPLNAEPLQGGSDDEEVAGGRAHRVNRFDPVTPATLPAGCGLPVCRTSGGGAELEPGVRFDDVPKFFYVDRGEVSAAAPAGTLRAGDRHCYRVRARDLLGQAGPLTPVGPSACGEIRDYVPPLPPIAVATHVAYPTPLAPTVRVSWREPAAPGGDAYAHYPGPAADFRVERTFAPSGVSPLTDGVPLTWTTRCDAGCGTLDAVTRVWSWTDDDPTAGADIGGGDVWHGVLWYRVVALDDPPTGPPNPSAPSEPALALLRDRLPPAPLQACCWPGMPAGIACNHKCRISEFPAPPPCPAVVTASGIDSGDLAPPAWWAEEAEQLRIYRAVGDGEFRFIYQREIEEILPDPVTGTGGDGALVYECWRPPVPTRVRYRIGVVDGNGNMTAGPTFERTLSPSPAPRPPTPNLSCAPAAAGGIRLSWQVPDVGWLEGFDVWREDIAAAPIGVLPAAARSFVDLGASPDRYYGYRVVARRIPVTPGEPAAGRGATSEPIVCTVDAPLDYPLRGVVEREWCAPPSYSEGSGVSLAWPRADGACGGWPQAGGLHLVFRSTEMDRGYVQIAPPLRSFTYRDASAPHGHFYYMVASLDPVTGEVFSVVRPKPASPTPFDPLADVPAPPAPLPCGAPPPGYPTSLYFGAFRVHVCEAGGGPSTPSGWGVLAASYPDGTPVGLPLSFGGIAVAADGTVYEGEVLVPYPVPVRNPAGLSYRLSSLALTPLGAKAAVEVRLPPSFRLADAAGVPRSARDLGVRMLEPDLTFAPVAYERSFADCGAAADALWSDTLPLRVHPTGPMSIGPWGIATASSCAFWTDRYAAANQPACVPCPPGTPDEACDVLLGQDPRDCERPPAPPPGADPFWYADANDSFLRAGMFTSAGVSARDAGVDGTFGTGAELTYATTAPYGFRIHAHGARFTLAGSSLREVWLDEDPGQVGEVAFRYRAYARGAGDCAADGDLLHAFSGTFDQLRADAGLGLHGLVRPDAGPDCEGTPEDCAIRWLGDGFRLPDDGAAYDLYLAPGELLGRVATAPWVDDGADAAADDGGTELLDPRPGFATGEHLMPGLNRHDPAGVLLWQCEGCGPPTRFDETFLDLYVRRGGVSHLLAAATGPEGRPIGLYGYDARALDWEFSFLDNERYDQDVAVQVDLPAPALIAQPPKWAPNELIRMVDVAFDCEGCITSGGLQDDAHLVAEHWRLHLYPEGVEFRPEAGGGTPECPERTMYLVGEAQVPHVVAVGDPVSEAGAPILADVGFAPDGEHRDTRLLEAELALDGFPWFAEDISLSGSTAAAPAWDPAANVQAPPCGDAAAPCPGSVTLAGRMVLPFFGQVWRRAATEPDGGTRIAAFVFAADASVAPYTDLPFAVSHYVGFDSLLAIGRDWTDDSDLGLSFGLPDVAGVFDDASAGAMVYVQDIDQALGRGTLIALTGDLFARTEDAAHEAFSDLAGFASITSIPPPGSAAETLADAVAPDVAQGVAAGASYLQAIRGLRNGDVPALPPSAWPLAAEVADFEALLDGAGCDADADGAPDAGSVYACFEQGILSDRVALPPEVAALAAVDLGAVGEAWDHFGDVSPSCDWTSGRIALDAVSGALPDFDLAGFAPDLRATIPLPGLPPWLDPESLAYEITRDGDHRIYTREPIGLRMFNYDLPGGVDFDLYLHPDRDAPRLEGGAGITTQLRLGNITIREMGGDFGLGPEIAYAGMWGSALIEMGANQSAASMALLVGRIPPVSPVLERDFPEVMESIARSEPPVTEALTGAYFRSMGDLPIISDGCVLSLNGGGETALFHFGGDDAHELGGRIHYFAHGRVACLLSVRADLEEQFRHHASGAWEVGGGGWAGAGIGWCSPASWGTQWDDRWWGDSWCAQAGAGLDVSAWVSADDPRDVHHDTRYDLDWE